MPSKQSRAVAMHWAAAAQARTPAEAPGDEEWGDLTAEPPEVDYTEVVAGGLPAMWAVRRSTRRR